MTEIVTTIITTISPAALPIVICVIGCCFIYFKINSQQEWYHVGLPEDDKVPRNQIYTKEI